MSVEVEVNSFGDVCLTDSIWDQDYLRVENKEDALQITKALIKYFDITLTDLIQQKEK